MRPGRQSDRQHPAAALGEASPRSDNFSGRAGLSAYATSRTSQIVLSCAGRGTAAEQHLRLEWVARVCGIIHALTGFVAASLDGPAPPNGATVRNCTLNLDQCLGPWWRQSHDRFRSGGAEIDSVDMFKRLAFEMPECGDCCEYA